MNQQDINAIMRYIAQYVDRKLQFYHLGQGGGVHLGGGGGGVPGFIGSPPTIIHPGDTPQQGLGPYISAYDHQHGWVGIRVYEADGSPDVYAHTIKLGTNLSLTDLGGYAARIDASGGGGGGTVLKTVWMPDAPPASAGSIDDEFDADSLSGSWTEFDPNSLLTATVDSGRNLLKLVQSTRSGDNLCGLYQTLPAGDFTAWTRVTIQAPIKNYTLGGLCLWEDPSDTSKKLFTEHLVFNGSITRVEAIEWTDHNTGAVPEFGYDLPQITHLYLRIRRNGSNYYLAYSLDGLSWREYDGTRNPTFTPTKVGLFSNNVNLGQNTQVTFSFFRYVASDVGQQGFLDGALASLLI